MMGAIQGKPGALLTKLVESNEIRGMVQLEITPIRSTLELIFYGAIAVAVGIGPLETMTLVHSSNKLIRYSMNIALDFPQAQGRRVTLEKCHEDKQEKKRKHVTFPDYNSEEEERRSVQGHQARKRRKEIKKILKMDAMKRKSEDEKRQHEREKEKKFNYSHVLLNEHLGEKLSEVYDGTCNGHSDSVSDKSMKEFKRLMNDFLFAMGVRENASMSARMKGLRQTNRTYEELVARPCAGVVLETLGQNACFQLHCKFVSDPLSSSDTEKKETLLRGVEKPGVKSAMSELSNHRPPHDELPPSVVRENVQGYLQCNQSYSTESGDNVDVEGATDADGGTHTGDSTDGESSTMEIDNEATASNKDDDSEIAVAHKVSEEAPEESALLSSYSADREYNDY
jgi:hypothetical protein